MVLYMKLTGFKSSCLCINVLCCLGIHKIFHASCLPFFIYGVASDC
uniref:Uncharacterized protein n=1 Tax=Rhizophora mucronata TaxID=61149 RepID=A0A2P2PRH6_RHIMU